MITRLKTCVYAMDKFCVGSCCAVGVSKVGHLMLRLLKGLLIDLQLIVSICDNCCGGVTSQAF